MSTYWQYYQLSFDPFINDQSDDIVYLSARFQQQLDLLVHLAMNEKNIQLVTGLTGVGKSTMMRFLLKALSNASGICKVHGGATITADIIQELLLRHLGLKVDPTQKDTYKALLQAKILDMGENHQHFYLLIDNAHKLPQTSLALLLELMDWQLDIPLSLHITLFGGPQLEAVFAELTSSHLGEHLTHTIRIAPLSLEDTQQYIQHRLAMAGWRNEFPFSSQQIEKIRQLSYGIPGKINSVAKQALRQKIKMKKTKKPSLLRRLPLTYMNQAIAGVIVIFLGYFIFFNQNVTENSDKLSVVQALEVHPQPMTQDLTSSTPLLAQMDETAMPQSMLNTTSSVTSESSSSTALVPNDSPDSRLPLRQGELASSDTALALPKESLAAPMPHDENLDTSTGSYVSTSDEKNVGAVLPTMPSNTMTEGAAGNSKPLTLTQAVHPALKASSTPSKEKSALASTVTSPKPVLITDAEMNVLHINKQAVMKNTSSVLPSVSGFADEKYILSRPKTNYALQIAGSYDFPKLQQNLALAHQDQNIRYFKTILHQKPWYVAVYGDYHSQEMAKASINSLPMSLRSNQPWPRSYGSIQEAIKAKV
jgi:DamX protein